jgi:hypothetical protein
MADYVECPCRGYRECPMCHDLRPCGEFGKSRWCPPCVRLRREGMRPRAKRRGVMPAGRICAGQGCETKLSVYNAGDRCSLCVNKDLVVRVP